MSINNKHKQARLLDLILKYSLDCIVLLDKNYNFIQVNRAFAKVFHRDQFAFQGHNYFDLFSADFKADADRAKAGKYIYQQPEYPLSFSNHPEQEPTYWDLALIPILDQTNEVELLLFTLRDVTKRKLAYDALQESEQKFRTLFEDSRDAIYITTFTGEIIDHNAAWIKLFGYSRAEFKLLKATELFFDAVDRKKFQTAIAADGHVKDLEIDYRHKDGTKMTCLETATVLRDNQGHIAGYQGTIRDMTDHIKVRKKLEKALEDAQQASQVKTQFIANISHEIRTPLTAINGFATLLKRNLEERLGPDEQDFFKYINLSSKRLMRTIDEILNVSQLEAGTVRLSPTKLHLGDIIRAIYNELRLEAEEKHLKFEFLEMTSTDEQVGDEYSISQAILNIIQNAIKYTNEGAVTIKLQHVQQQLTLTISDTGIGISEQYRARMFEPYSQESEGFTKHYQGIGLGLALAKRYLDLNQIELKVFSKKQQGSTFTLIFPKSTGG